MAIARFSAIVAVGAAFLAGCALAPLPPERALQGSDLSRLAGEWEWSSMWVTPARLGPGPIRVRLADGRMVFETTATYGTLTLFEGQGRRVLKGEGRDRSGGTAFEVVLTQRALSDSVRPATAAAFGLVVVP
jgi:hypothetical protein